MTPLLPDPYLRNQSHVRFTSGLYPSIAYSNVVSIPLFGPAITVRKTADAAQAELGSTIVYRVAVANDGNAPADVALYDPLPAGTSVVSNSVLLDGVPLPGADPPSGIPLGSLAPGGRVAVSFQLVVIAIPESRTIANRARAEFSFATPEGRISRGEAESNEVTVQVIGIKVSASIRTRWSQTFAGDVVYYDLVVMNEGAGPVSGVNVVVSLPQGLTFLAGSVTVDDVRAPGAVPASGIAVGTIAAGGSAVVTFAGQVGDLPDGSVLQVNALVFYSTSGEIDSTGTNTASVVVVKPEATLTMTASPDQAAPGDPITYTLVAYNASRIAIEATLQDLLPAGLIFVAGSVTVAGIPAAYASPGTGVPLGTISPDGRVVVAFQARVPPLASGDGQLPEYTNQAQLIYAFRLNDGRAVRAVAVSDTVITRVVSPFIAVGVKGDPSEVYPGDDIVYRAEVTNKGNVAASVFLEGLVPAGTRLAGFGIQVDGAPTAILLDGSAALGALEPDQSKRIGYRVTVPEDTMLESVEGFLTARYTFALNGREHAGTSKSNEYSVSVEGIEE
ncbi:conserved repeat domain-containing protein [Cohnella sp. OV330]|uniref:DUF11 domain-containing protein n=1 Tax=Cohnella sp. OV330 TaxID=1855288 RepID=UPI0008F254A3|nr:DUF11 domain-containing protein [Cohnella sp. OV330]SFB44752.1 conserved repeat domain-containing protein [Cohnella sp. OV330]